MASNKQTRKFLFFDEVKETQDKNDTKNIEVKKEEKNETEKENENTDKPKEKLNFSLNSAIQIRGIQCLDEVIFLCGKVVEMVEKHMKNMKIGILKIYDNKLIDIYIMSNDYYDYQLIKFQDKPTLIVFGAQKKIHEK